jgi:transcriptional regulatory protein RtcR
VQRLRWLWQHTATGESVTQGVALDGLLSAESLVDMDLFDRIQLEAVVNVCRQARTLSDAGRKLFGRSRTQRTVVNDADRLRKYLQKYGLSWEAVSA